LALLRRIPSAKRTLLAGGFQVSSAQVRRIRVNRPCGRKTQTLSGKIPAGLKPVRFRRNPGESGRACGNVVESLKRQSQAGVFVPCERLKKLPARLAPRRLLSYCQD
jgi:hypothetical protein